MDHVLLLVLLTIQPVVIPTTLVVIHAVGTIDILGTLLENCATVQQLIVSFLLCLFFSECTFSCALGYEANSACDSCAPVHICLTNDPCQNGTTCNIGTNSNTDYTCSCVSSFTGKNCCKYHYYVSMQHGA